MADRNGAAEERQHTYIADRQAAQSVGPALSEEPDLGPLTLPAFLREVARRYGAREALVLHEGDERAIRWSYDDLHREAMQVARALVARGIAKGERVGVLMTNRPEFLSAAFGIALAGGVAVPLSTFSTAPELEYLLAASCCSTLLMEARVLNRDFAAMLGEIEPAVIDARPGTLQSAKLPFLRRIVAVDRTEDHGTIEAWDDFLQAGDAAPVALVAARADTVVPADPAVLFFSSGSTAKPKGILSAHRGVTVQMWRMARQQGLDPDVRYWTANGFFWSGNFAMALGATLAIGGTLILQRTFQPGEAVSLMERERASFLFAWPHQWEQLISAPGWAEADLSSLRYVDAASPIAAHPSVTSDWIEPRHAYGNTETFTLVTAYPANTDKDVGKDSHGLPLPGNVVRIVDPVSGKPVAVGENGEIAVKGPTLMMGYLGIPLDETLDDEGFFRTGDGGWIDEDGRLFWEGRLGEIIKTGGANVSPLEIDEAILQMPGVRIAKTVGIPDDKLGEMVVTCVVRHEGQSFDAPDVRAFAAKSLASYKVPRRVLFFAEDELAATGSAKIKVAELKQAVIERLDQEAGERRA